MLLKKAKKSRFQYMNKVIVSSHPPDSIFIRVIGENEVKPKSI